MEKLFVGEKYKAPDQTAVGWRNRIVTTDPLDKKNRCNRFCCWTVKPFIRSSNVEECVLLHKDWSDDEDRGRQGYPRSESNR